MPKDPSEFDLEALYTAAVRGDDRLEGKPYYEPAADSLFFFFKEGAANAQRIDGLVTLYRSIETGELVGIQLKRIKKFINELVQRGVQPPEITLKVILTHVVESQNQPRWSFQELLSLPEAEQPVPEEALN